MTSKPLYMFLVVADMGSNPVRIYFFWQPKADPDCDFMSSIFLRATDAFMLLEQLASLSDDWSMLQKSSCFCLKRLNHLSILIPMLSLRLAISLKVFQTRNQNCNL